MLQFRPSQFTKFTQLLSVVVSSSLCTAEIQKHQHNRQFMASRMGTAPALENQIPERSYTTPATCLIHNCCSEPTFKIQTSNIRINFQSTRQRWRIAFPLDTGGVPDNGGQEGINGNNSNLNATRLGRIVIAGGRQLLEKLNLARKNVPMKLFLLLLGFYTANALATILGQTGDWDVLVAGIVVAAIEGIGMLMYRKPPSQSSGRLKSFVMMVNYWKAGVCLGLFVDAFKLGS
ncbi:ycf20-like protein isoform X1 [Malus domestica]|uniref:ycf20-like protein isoform X1 n=1 Tax=Malus domestica TaxID=3750 RepID=UPI00397619BF